MPVRDERLFWLHAKTLDPRQAAVVEEAHTEFLKRWKDSAVAMASCVQSSVASDRLWLLRLKSTDAAVTTRFNQALQAYLKTLPGELSIPGLRVKRQSNLPTPLVCPRLEGWPITDLGLHVVNDQYNGTLITFSYHEGRYYHIPHLDLNNMAALTQRVRTAWLAHACECYRSASGCGCSGVGCWECFAQDCSICAGTGWRAFVSWQQLGCQVDYGGGVPIAVTQSSNPRVQATGFARA